MRARFVTLNVMILSGALASWWSGFFAGMPHFMWQEEAMLLALLIYGMVGFVAAFLGRWQTASHLANGAPIVALAMTGMGMLIAVSDLQALNPQALALVFREMAYAIAPNILGVLILVWLRELAYWCAGEEI